jgi:predicted RecA/RadA family phage recombinase
VANNYKSSGKRITVAGIAAPVAAGVLCRQKGVIGIPLDNALAGQSVSFAIEGIWGMTYANYGGAVLPAAGSICYWDTSANALSNGGANDDFAAVKCITGVSAVDGSFEGLLLDSANGKPIGQTQA